MRAQRIIAGVLALVLTGCVGTPTSLRLTLEPAENIELTDLEVRIGERIETLPALAEFDVWVPDGWAGAEVQIEVVGIHGGTRVAAGRALAIPQRGASVDVAVPISRVSCGAWCAEGETECSGDTVRVCTRGADGCMGFEPMGECPTGCSLGACRDTCIDECAEGEVQCAGPTGLRRCGENDSDACLDWLPVEPCGDGYSCSAGQCVEGCADACDADGMSTCRGGGLASCGDRNADGCLEWGPVSRCEDGSSCSDGACVAGCEDECDKNSCSGDSERICGQFDEDPCMDLSPGMSCRRPGTCEIGSCGEDGCVVQPVVCESPPENNCVGPDTLRTYQAVGTCAGGACDYAFEDRECANCPACDPCAGVTCDSPPADSCADADTRRTFAAAGTCDGGSCTYAPTDEDCDAPPAPSCVDGDTRRTFSAAGTCDAGLCRYAATDEDCSSPPAPTCVDGVTRRVFDVSGACDSGECAYTYTDETCAAGCVAGACSSTTCTPFGGDTFGNAGCSVSMTPAALPCPDISGTGTATGLGDDAQMTVAIGFDFGFYGASYANATIQSNGALTFTSGASELDYANECLPHTTDHNPMIAAFWDDLDPSQPGAEIVYQTRGSSPNRTFQVQWSTPVYRSGGGGDPGRFSVVLHEGSDRVEVCYHDVTFMDAGHDGGASATVGIQSATDSLSYSCNGGALGAGLYLEYSPPVSAP